MGGRAFAEIALMILAGCSDAPPRHISLAEGAMVPAGWLPTAATDGPGVIWIFRTDDCLSCHSFDYSLRRL